jgi:hypothetical protein
MPDPRAGQPFDATAKARAKALAAAVGKPGTREAGLLAIHAVLQKKRFRVEEDAYLFYSVKRRTFYEWKPLVEAAEAHLNDSSGRLESYWHLPSSSSQPSSSRWSIAAINQVILTAPRSAAHCWFLTACSMPQVLYEDWQMEVRTLQYMDELTAEWQDREYGEDTDRGRWKFMWQPAEKAHASVLADRLHVAHDKLILPDNWLSQNAPILLDDVFFLGPHHKLVCSPMRDPDNARRLKRVLTVEGSGSNWPLIVECVHYSLPSSPHGDSDVTRQQRIDRHRRREEAAFRRLRDRLIQDVEECERDCVSGSESDIESE